MGLCRDPGPPAGQEVEWSVAVPSLGSPNAQSRTSIPVQAYDRGSKESQRQVGGRASP